MSNLYQLDDTVVDLSQIKSISVAKIYANDTEKKRIIVELRDRIVFYNGRNSDDGRETIPESLELMFGSEVEARKALKELSEAWNSYINSKTNG